MGQNFQSCEEGQWGEGAARKRDEGTLSSTLSSEEEVSMCILQAFYVAVQFGHTRPDRHLC
jgi:hypothetical protein